MSYSDSLAGRAVVVTGAFGHLGSAVVRVLRARGARVGLLDNAQPSSELAVDFDVPHFVLGGVDLTQIDAAVQAMAIAVARLGQLDVLVNIAGGFCWQTLEQGELVEWDNMYLINLKTAVVATKAALPALLRSPAGRIINIGAGAAAKSAAAGMGPYIASKVGVHKFTESLADELKDRRITVNAIVPGTIDTPKNRVDMPNTDFSRWVEPLAIAKVVAFLSSSEAAAVNGALIPVTGRG